MVIMTLYHPVRIKGKPTPRLIPDQLLLCSKCKSTILIPYDYVRRICLSWNGRERWFEIPRGFCLRCQMFHRMLPDKQVPYKHYAKEVISTHLKYPPNEPLPCELPQKTYDLLCGRPPHDLTISNWLTWRENGYRHLPNHPAYDCFERKS